MARVGVKKFWRYISVAVFLSCFAFDSVYTGPTYEAKSSLTLLIAGIFGVFAGYFSWLANPLFISALIYKNRNVSIALSIASVILALSFLRQDELMVSEAPTYDDIVAYGPGYFLWVLSMTILTLGESLNNAGMSSRKLIASLAAFVVISGSVYLFHYAKGADSIFQIMSRRAMEFERLCGGVKEKIYRPASNVSGVYLDDVPGLYFLGVSGQRYSGHGHERIRFKENEMFDFLEKNSRGGKGSETPYVRIYLREPNVRMPADIIKSNYAIRADELGPELPESLGITGYRIYVESLQNNTVIAETSFVNIRQEIKLCSPIDAGTYSVRGFIGRVLGL